MSAATGAPGIRDLPEPARRILLTHLVVLRQGMRGPSRLRNAVLHEILTDLVDATETYLDSGRAPVDAACLAVGDFGDPTVAAREISATLLNAGRERRTRATGALALCLALVWCAIFLCRWNEPWLERTEPVGIDTSDVVATISLSFATLLATVCVVVSFLRRRGWIDSSVSWGERVLSAANLATLGCAALALGESVGIRVQVAPDSLSTSSLVLAGCAVLALVAGWPRNRTPRMADPLD